PSEYLPKNGTIVCTSSDPLFPQANAMAKRVFQTIKRILKKSNLDNAVLCH
ncbi:Hypothetical predicted protein, partial [Podarcis lilfordi]